MSVILDLAELSRLSYKGSRFIIGSKKHTLDKGKFKKELLRYGYENPVIFDDADSGLMCFIVKRDGITHLIFRGTSNLKNFLTDVKARKKKTEDGEVHEGFDEATEKMLTFVLTILRKHDIILIGGHSLGSALAVRTKVLLEKKGYNIKFCSGIGSPMVGTKKYIKNTSKLNCLEVLNNLDAVTGVPCRLWGWRHYNNLYFNCEGTLEANKGYFARKINRLTTLIKNRNPMEWLEDHSSNDYCRLLRQNRHFLEKYEKEVLGL